MACFVLVGGVIRLVSQLLQVNLAWSPLESFMPWQLNKALLMRYGQAMLSGSMLLLFPVIARALASYEGEGSVALFNYATRLIEFPLAIAITFLAAVFFPRMAKTFSVDVKLHKQLIHYGVQITLGVSLVAAITLVLLSSDYADFVYGYGDMKGSNIDQVATLISIGLMALPLQGVSFFLTAVFNARKNMKTPMFINGVGLLFFLMTYFAHVFGAELQALMWGMLASYGLICVLQFIFLRIEGFKWSQVIFDKLYIAGVFCAVATSIGGNSWIVKTELSAGYSLMLACFVALLSLLVMAIFNKKFRSIINIGMCK